MVFVQSKNIFSLENFEEIGYLERFLLLIKLLALVLTLKQIKLCVFLLFFFVIRCFLCKISPAYFFTIRTFVRNIYYCRFSTRQ